MTDTELLNQYARDGSQDAFAQLVQRHYAWVRAVAARLVTSPHLADDVAQVVFMVLAKKASSLPRNTSTASWLFKVTQYTASNANRTERRRRKYEQDAAAMQRTHDAPTSESTELALDLDALVARLKEKDRSALLLRYYQQLSLAQLGAALGVSEDAARKRVDHALARLRNLFERKGIALPSTGMGLTLAGATAITPISAATLHSVALTATGAMKPAMAVSTLFAQSLHALTIATVQTFAVATVIVMTVVAGLSIAVATSLSNSASSGSVVAALAATTPTSLPLQFNAIDDTSEWVSTSWAQTDDSYQNSVSATKFSIFEPDRWHVWIRELHQPIDTSNIPILKVTYRSTKTTSALARYALWMDDGTGPDNGGLYYFMPTDVLHDGKPHTFTYDTRRRDTKGRLVTGPIKTLAIGVAAGPKATQETPAMFELIDLHFEAAPRGK